MPLCEMEDDKKAALAKEMRNSALNLHKYNRLEAEIGKGEYTMVKIIMHGCNGHMGQVISGIVEKDPDAEIVAGIDIADQGKNSYPVFTDIDACQVEADAIIDFSSAKATDKLLEYSAARQIPLFCAVPV